MSIFDFIRLYLCSITFFLATFLVSTRPGGVISSKAGALLEHGYGYKYFRPCITILVLHHSYFGYFSFNSARPGGVISSKAEALLGYC